MSRPEDRPNDLDTPPIRAGKRFWIGLGIITALAFAWRVFYVIHERGRLLLNGDAFYYHWQSILIARGKGFIDPFEYVWWGRTTPSAGHPPAYILYLAGVAKFIGTSELTQRLASTVLGAGAVFMLGVLARRIFGNDWAGWTAAALAGAYAHLWINDEMLMSESMYVLTIAFAVWTAYNFWDRPRVRTAALMGFGVALAALSRAEAIALFPLLVIPFAFLVTRKAGARVQWKQGLRLGFAACLVGGLLMAPWVLYNLTRFDRPVVLSNGAGSVLMVSNCDSTVPAGQPDAGTYRGTYHGTYVGYWSIYCAENLPGKLRHFYSSTRASDLIAQLGDIPGTDTNFFGDESTHEVAWRAVGQAELKDHLRQTPRVVLLRVGRMWDLYRPEQNIFLNGVLEGRGKWQSRLATYEYFPLLALSIFGLVLLRRRKVPILPFIAIGVAITITAATSFGITRYRAPVDAMLPVLAGGALVWIFEWIRARVQTPRASPAPLAAQ